MVSCQMVTILIKHKNNQSTVCFSSNVRNYAEILNIKILIRFLLELIVILALQPCLRTFMAAGHSVYLLYHDQQP